MFDTGSHEWLDPNETGFSSDKNFNNTDEIRLNPTDRGHYKYDSDEFVRELLSHDPTNMFQEAEATAADTDTGNEQQQRIVGTVQTEERDDDNENDVSRSNDSEPNVEECDNLEQGEGDDNDDTEQHEENNDDQTKKDSSTNDPGAT